MEYRWGELFDGRPHVYRAGRDFDMPPADFARLVEQKAEENGLGVAVRIDGQFVAIHALPIAERNLAPSEAMEARIDEAMALRAQGWTYRAIGEHFGVDIQVARRLILREQGRRER
jgi:hypothetical protein